MNATPAINSRISGFETIMVGATWNNYLFIRLVTDNGLTGIGEATMQWQARTVASAADHLIKRYVLGADPFAIEKTVAIMYREEYARGGPTLNSAIAGIEMAMWDLCGKLTGQPVYNLLGGKVRDTVPAYANGWFAGAKTPEDWAAAASRVVDMGYGAMKFDPFWPDARDPDPARIRSGLEIVAAVREAAGTDMRLLIDGHGRFSPGTANEIAHRMAEFDIHWFEEPIDPENHAMLARMQRPGGLRIATGERCWSRYQVPQLIETGKPDVLQPDIVQVGGILESKKIAAIADSHYLPVSFHNPFGPVATAAAVQLDANVTNVYLQESFCEFDTDLRHKLVRNAPCPTGGAYSVPDLPGLGGVELDDDVAAEHPYREDARISIWNDLEIF